MTTSFRDPRAQLSWTVYTPRRSSDVVQGDLEQRVRALRSGSGPPEICSSEFLGAAGEPTRSAAILPPPVNGRNRRGCGAKASSEPPSEPQARPKLAFRRLLRPCGPRDDKRTTPLCMLRAASRPRGTISTNATVPAAVKSVASVPDQEIAHTRGARA